MQTRRAESVQDVYPLYYVSLIDRRYWFNEYCEAKRQNVLDLLRGEPIRFPVPF